MLKLHLNSQNSLAEVHQKQSIFFKKGIFGTEGLDVTQGVTLKVLDPNAIFDPVDDSTVGHLLLLSVDLALEVTVVRSPLEDWGVIIVESQTWNLNGKLRIRVQEILFQVPRRI